VSKTKEVLLAESKFQTQKLKELRDETTEQGKARRRIWSELNNLGVTQREIAQHCGVVGHTVYTELRKLREGK
jgi:Trp operon repressor